MSAFIAGKSDRSNKEQTKGVTMLAKAIIAGLLTALLIALPNKQTPAPLQSNQSRGIASKSSLNTAAVSTTDTVQSKTLQAQLTPKRDEVSPQTQTVPAPEAPKPETKVAVQTQVTGCENYRSLINQYDWNHEIALAIMRAESGCNPSATNTANTDGSTDRGLFQVNSIHRQKVTNLEDLYEPATNISVAYRIYQGQGWQAWSVYNSGKYLRYL